ncbi:hypothetical protein D3C87_1581420 [compost metagenome]
MAGDMDDMLPFLENGHGKFLVDDVVLDQEDPQRREGLGDELRDDLGLGIVRANCQGHVEMEGATLADLAFQLDRATHQVNELPGNGEAQAGSAVLAGDRVVCLGEGVEDDVLFLGGDADAGVANGEA